MFWLTGFLWKASQPASKKYCCIDRAKSEERKKSLVAMAGGVDCTKRTITSKICIVFCWYFVDDDGMHEMENGGGDVE